jgi:hypothetical protein
VARAAGGAADDASRHAQGGCGSAGCERTA